jgi:2,5-furandicarboxylate decarboxylase 1
VRDVYFTHGGGGFYHAVVQIDQTMPGWTKQAIMATFAAFPPLKMVTVVDCDVDIREPMDVEWAMTERLDAAKDIHVIENVFGHGLNPTFPGYLGAKVGFDATRPFPYTPDWDRSTYKSVDLSEWRIEVPELRAPSEPVVEAPAAPAPQPAAGNGRDASSGQTFGPNGPEGGKKKKKKKKSKGRRGNGLPDLSGVSGGELEAQVAAVLADWLSRSEERK